MSTTVDNINDEYIDIYNSDEIIKLSEEMDDKEVRNYLYESFRESNTDVKRVNWIVLINKVKYNNFINKAFYDLGIDNLYEYDMEYIGILEEELDLYTRVNSYNKEVFDLFRGGFLSKREALSMEEIICRERCFNINFISEKINSNAIEVNTGFKFIVNEGVDMRNSIDKFDLFFKEFVALKKGIQLVK